MLTFQIKCDNVDTIFLKRKYITMKINNDAIKSPLKSYFIKDVFFFNNIFSCSCINNK